jgi:sugar/nucleoside kinase (ribokinase family)
LADYGHGFFGEILIDKLTQSNCFLAVNTQANAGNRGFNTFAKYPRIDFLSLNGGELELELRQKNLDYNLVVPKIMKMKQCRNAVVTLGASGLLSFDQNGKSFWTPAFASKVIDKVGAGDSVLAISSMLSFLAAPVEIIGLLASVVAAFEVAQLGHANSLDTIMMKKYVKGLLG